MEKCPIPETKELKNLSFFRRLSDEEITNIRKFLQVYKFHKDETIFSEGDTGDKFYILLQGSVNIFKKANGDKLELLNNIDQNGDYFGEMSLWDDHPRSATAIAEMESRLLSISKGEFLDLTKRYPELTISIANSVANFLRKADQKLIQILKEKNAELEATYNRLQFAQEELITKERLTLVGKLAASLMHDIRNPMTAISGYAQLIKEENCPKEKVSQYADRIVMEVNFFMEMAQELLLFARGEGILRKEEVDFNTFLQDFINIIGPKFKEQGFTVKCKNDFNDKVSIDTSRFRRALENICNNAMEAMSEGGAFLIEGLCVKNGLRIALTDNGCGMTDFVKDHIFDEFFSHGKKQGTGLGLSITKRIIEEHGGSIRVESQLGLGTRFIIDLP